MDFLEPEESEETLDEPQLDASILALLGDKSTKGVEVGPVLQKDLAARWSALLKQGLPENDQEKIMAKYAPPENCSLLGSSKLNPEVTSVLNEQVTRRDAKLQNYQIQMGVALSALGQLLTHFLSEQEVGKLTLIELASDASQLLLDLFHKQSTTRRELVTLNIHKDLKETLLNAPLDEFLFGEKLGDRVKASKELEKSSLVLKPKPKLQPKSSVSITRIPLNYPRPPRSINRGASRGGRLQRVQAPIQQQHYASRQNPVVQERRRQKVDFRKPAQSREYRRR